MVNRPLIALFYLLPLTSISSNIIIIFKTNIEMNGFNLIIKEQLSNLNADIKVNNQTVNYTYNNNKLTFKSEKGEIYINIHTNLTSFKEMFSTEYYHNNANYDFMDNYFLSIKIKTIDVYATDLEGLFQYSSGLTSVDLSEFDISHVTSFKNMFKSCSNLVSVKFGNYRTTNAITMNNMFSYCYSLVSLDLSSFETSKIIDMSYLFISCSSLLSLDLSSFVTSKVKDMSYLFSHCIKLSSLNIKNFNVSTVQFFNSMFDSCSSLTYLDLSDFINLEAINTENMFKDCKSLISLDLNGFLSSKVKNMANMFNGCSLLTNLKIDNFDTSSVTDMSAMFSKCNYLTSLNISNFKGTNVIKINEMFSECYFLTSLDFNNFKATNITTMEKMFYSCFNLKSLNLKNFETFQTTNMESMFFGCKSLIYLNINNFNTDNCINMRSMFQNCASLTSLNLSNFQITEKTNYDNIVDGISENLMYCVNDDFYEKIESKLNKKKCAIRDNNCIPDWHNKSKKIISHNGECVEKCNETENYKYEYENKCYSSCPIGTTSLYNNDFLCQIFNDKKYKDFINNTKQNQDIKTNNANNDENKTPNNCNPVDFFKNKCKFIKNNKSLIEMIKHDIEEGLMNDFIDDIIQNKIDIYQMDDNIKYQITSSFNQKYKTYDNISVIDLQRCENKLKEVYGISQNETLIIFKYDYISEKILVPIIGYEVFNPITKNVLDLNKCKNIKIMEILPTTINNSEIYKHDPNNLYFRDKCSSFSNEKGVDMTLYDRKTEYNNKNYSLCSDNCDYINYNNETKKIICQCEPQFNSSLITWDKLINGKKLLHNFLDIKKSTNINVIKCYKKFISLTGLKNNIGNYVILFVMLIYLVGLILFLFIEYKLLKEKIEKIIINYQQKNISKNLITKDNSPIHKNSIVNKKIGDKTLNEKNIIISYNNSSIRQFKLKKGNKGLLMQNQKENERKKVIKDEKDNSTNYSDSELNVSDFSIAQKNDKRNYLECYISLVKTRHPLISSFYPNNDYNSMSIKICLFFFTFALNFFSNTLFFTDETMHKIIEDEGIFNFIYNLPITIYSTFISFVIIILLKKLALFENSIIEIRKQKTLKDMKEKSDTTKKNLIIRFVLFFIISFILLLAFWIYIGCFCAVYTKTQIYLIKDTLISFVLSLILPFIKYIFVCSLRIKSLNNPGEFLYCISQILQ